MAEAPRFEPESLLETLTSHGVEFVLIGSLAAVLYGSSIRTGDVDICPRRTADNLRRLADALEDLQTRIRAEAEPEDVPFVPHLDLLSRLQVVNLTTRFGDFDISFEPAGTASYDELARNAVELKLGGTQVVVASLEDVIRSKEAARRDKDRRTLPLLYALQDEIAERETKR